MPQKTKMDDCFSICQYKTQEPKNIEISPSISLEVRQFRFEARILSLDLKWVYSKLILKSAELKMLSY